MIVLMLLLYALRMLFTGDFNVYCFEDNSGCQIENDSDPVYHPMFRIVWPNND